MEIPIGLKGRAESLSSPDTSARAACSGALEVYGTPFMTALMEKAAWTSLAPCLAPGESTVGTRLNVSHLSATPMGMKVWAESEVTAVEGRKITLTVRAYDEAGLIGEGSHERFVVQEDRFLSKAAQKKKP